eukprot:gene33881-38288_t
MDLLNDMALFVEVAKVLSFRRASEVTGIPNSTLSRRITALEKAIGLRLMHRTTRRIELTEAGQIYFERCKRIVDEARLAHELEGAVTAPRVLTLSAQASVFSIEFAALHYTDPGQNRYAYQLDGFDRDWVLTDAGHRNASYTNLNPGTYTFRVRAANHRGLWTAEPASMTIIITPPFWQRWWFRAALGLLVLSALPGTVAWQQALAAGGSAQFSAEHTIRYPKDADVVER